MHEQVVSSSSAVAGVWLGDSAPAAGVVKLAAGSALSVLAVEAASSEASPSNSTAQPSTCTYLSRTGSTSSGLSESSSTQLGSAGGGAAAGLVAGSAAEPLAVKVLRGQAHAQSAGQEGLVYGAPAAANDGAVGVAGPAIDPMGTPKAAPGHAKQANGYTAAAARPSSLEASLHGLTINGAASLCDSPINFGHEPDSPSITFEAPPAGTTPRAPVEVFARFPPQEKLQQQSQPSQQPARPQQPRPQSAGGSYSPHNSRRGFLSPRSPHQQNPPNGAPMATPMPGFLSPRSPHRQTPPNGAPMATPMPLDPSPGGFLPVYPGYGAPYYPQQIVGSPPGAAGMPPPYMMHSGAFYGMVAPAWYGSAGSIAPLSPTGLAVPGPVGAFPHQPRLSKGGNGRAGAVPAAQYDPEFARQYNSMVAYMQHQGYSAPSSGVEVEGAWSPREPTSARSRRTGSSVGGGGSSYGSGRGRGGVEVPPSPLPHASPVASYPSYHSSSPSSRGGKSGSAAGSSSITTPRSAPSLQLQLDDSEVVSDVLDQYKADRESRDSWQLESIRGHVYAFCCDQLGSRFVQQSLDSCSREAILDLFNEIEPRLLDLMCDVFGNYVIQRFLQLGGEPVQSRVAEAIHGRVLALSLQMYGCRVVQKALEVFDPAGRVAIVKELQGHTQQCVRDQNGNHVVQKVIECVQPSDPAWSIIESIVAKTQQLSCHTFGCRLVQRVLEYCTIQQLKERAVSEVLSNSLQLAHDQYGNYVVQHLVAKGPEAARAALVSKFAPQVLALAQHKFASNVVEACFKHVGGNDRELLIRHMTSDASLRSGALLAVMRDQYGNYVVQRALEVADEQQRLRLLAAIRPLLGTLRKYTYGKHIVARVDAMLAAAAGGEPRVRQPPPPPSAAATPGQQEQEAAATKSVTQPPPVDLFSTGVASAAAAGELATRVPLAVAAKAAPADAKLGAAEGDGPPQAATGAAAPA